MVDDFEENNAEFGEKCKSADNDARELWFVQHRGLSWSWARRLELEPDYDGDDVLQESSFKLFEWLDKGNVYTDRISPTIIRNEAISLQRHLKAEKRGGGARPISLNAEIAGSDGKSLAETIQARSNDISIGIDDLKILDLALTRLDPKDRDIILDRNQGMSSLEIAKLLGITEANERKRYGRALKALRLQYICCHDEIRK